MHPLHTTGIVTAILLSAQAGMLYAKLVTGSEMYWIVVFFPVWLLVLFTGLVVVLVNNNNSSNSTVARPIFAYHVLLMAEIAVLVANADFAFDTEWKTTAAPLLILALFPGIGLLVGFVLVCVACARRSQLNAMRTGLAFVVTTWCYLLLCGMLYAKVTGSDVRAVHWWTIVVSPVFAVYILATVATLTMPSDAHRIDAAPVTETTMLAVSMLLLLFAASAVLKVDGLVDISWNNLYVIVWLALGVMWLFIASFMCARKRASVGI